MNRDGRFRRPPAFATRTDERTPSMLRLRSLAARARRSGLLSLALMILVMLAFRSAVAD